MLERLKKSYKQYHCLKFIVILLYNIIVRLPIMLIVLLGSWLSEILDKIDIKFWQLIEKK